MSNFSTLLFYIYNYIVASALYLIVLHQNVSSLYLFIFPKYIVITVIKIDVYSIVFSENVLVDSSAEVYFVN